MRIQLVRFLSAFEMTEEFYALVGLVGNDGFVLISIVL